MGDGWVLGDGCVMKSAMRLSRWTSPGEDTCTLILTLGEEAIPDSIIKLFNKHSKICINDQRVEHNVLKCNEENISQSLDSSRHVRWEHFRKLSKSVEPSSRVIKKENVS